MKGQIDWLNKELGEKTKELMNNRKEQVLKYVAYFSAWIVTLVFGL